MLFSKALEIVKNFNDYGTKTLDYILSTYITEGQAKVIKELLSILEPYDYMLIGGYAVSFYYKGARPVSPEDIDIKIDPNQVEELLKVLRSKGFKILRKNFDPASQSQWVIVKKGSQQADIGFASKPWEFEALSKPKVFYYYGIKVKVIPPEYSIITKLFAGRQKDLRDVVFLLKSGMVDFEKVKKLVRKFLPSMDLEELQNLYFYAQKFDDEKVWKIFEGSP